MARKIDAYVDTSAFIALLDRSDSHHPLFRRLFADPPRIATTPLVLAEGQAWFLRRFDSGRALQFMAFVEALKPLEVLALTEVDVRSGARWLRRFADQSLTLTDAVGLDLLDRHAIPLCWSTDRHLSLGGASLAIHEG